MKQVFFLLLAFSNLSEVSETFLCTLSDKQCRLEYYKTGNGKYHYPGAQFYWPFDLFLTDVKQDTGGAVFYGKQQESYKYLKEISRNVLQIKNYCLKLGDYSYGCQNHSYQCKNAASVEFKIKISSVRSHQHYILTSGCMNYSFSQIPGFTFLWTGNMYKANACFGSQLWTIYLKDIFIDGSTVNVTIAWNSSALKLYVNNNLVGKDFNPKVVKRRNIKDKNNLYVGCPHDLNTTFKMPQMEISDVLVYHSTQIPQGLMSKCLTKPLGMEDGSINNSHIYASSSMTGRNNKGYFARLNNLDAWTASVKSRSQWLLIDFGKGTSISAIATQGHPMQNNYVVSYYISYTENYVHWEFYLERNTYKKFKGNTDQHSIVFHYLPRPIYGRILRFHPTEWHNNISLRCEVYGCVIPPTSSKISTVISNPTSSIPTFLASLLPSISSPRETKALLYSELCQQSSILKGSGDRSCIFQPKAIVSQNSKYISSSTVERSVSLRSSYVEYQSTYPGEQTSIINVDITLSKSSFSEPSSLIKVPSLIVPFTNEASKSTVLPMERYSKFSPVPTSIGSVTSYLNISDDIAQVENDVKALRKNSSNSKIKEVAKDLYKVSNKTMTGNEIELVIDLMSNLTEIQHSLAPMEKEDTEEFMQAITTIASSCLKKGELPYWNRIDKPLFKANQLIDVMNSLAECAKRSLENGFNEIRKRNKMSFNQENLEMEVSVVSKDLFNGSRFQSKKHPEIAISIPREVRQFVSSSNQSTVGVNNMVLYTIGEILRPRTNNQRALISMVTTCKVLNANESSIPLKSPAIMSFVHTVKNVKRNTGTCSYLNVSSLDVPELPIWWSRGCTVLTENVNTTTCKCYHLTNFAVLMDVHGLDKYVSQKDKEILSTISIVGSVVTILCCLTTLLSFTMTRKKSKTIFIHSNLIICLTLVHAVFLLSIWDAIAANEIPCKGVAVSLHFFLLCMFSWMAVEGMHIYSKLVKVFYSRKRRAIYAAIGWGIPLVSITLLAIFAFEKYGLGGRNSICWIDQEFIWVFAGPVAAVILANLFVLTSVSIVLVRRDRYKIRRKAIWRWEEKMRTVCKVTFMLLPLLGISWIIGFFMINQNSIILIYVFNILNGLQGIHIFIGYSVLDEDIRKAVLAKWTRKRRRSTTTDSKLKSLSSPTGSNTMHLMRMSRKWPGESLGYFFRKRMSLFSSSHTEKEKNSKKQQNSAIKPERTENHDQNTIFPENETTAEHMERIQKLFSVQKRQEDSSLSSMESEDKRMYLDKHNDETSFKSNGKPPSLRWNSWIENNCKDMKSTEKE